jgi:cytochrome c
MRFVIAAIALTLAACGPSSPPASKNAANPAPVPHLNGETAEDSAAQQARIGALAAPFNEASYAAGRRVFAQCRSCHTLEAGAGNRVGPNLHGVFGRAIGSAAGFSYSPVAAAADFTWDGAQLEQWLADPQTFLPGNRMAFAGIRNPEQRRDLIAYLIVETTPED